MAYCNEVAEDPGEVVIPRQERDGPAYDALAEELGATWLRTAYGRWTSRSAARVPRADLFTSGQLGAASVNRGGATR